MIPARSAGHSAGPAELIRSAAIARRYYLDGRSKLEIAEEFGLSRFKVARLLDEARASPRGRRRRAGREALVSLRGPVGRAAAQLVPR